jgi:hypothetical protein
MHNQEIAGTFVFLQFLFFGGFMLFGAGAFAFWIWMLIDCLKFESSEGNDKLIWVLVIVLTNWIGALIYFFVRRGERRLLSRRHGSRRHGSGGLRS